MKYAYLLINLFTIFFPVLLSFDKRVQFYRSWRYIWPGMLITGLLFLGWDVLFTVKGVWSFNSKYITGITLFHLPLEEILFFLTVPFACIFIYSCLNFYVKAQTTVRIATITSNLLIIVAVLMLVFFYNKVYTLITFGLLLILMVLLQYALKVSWLSRFYRAYALSLIPFYLINGILTAVPIVLYNNAQNMGYRVGTIPVEDHFYSMCLLLMNVGFFELFKTKQKKQDG